MYFDYENIFSKDQALKTTAASDNVIDVGRDMRTQKDVGPGTPIQLYITVSETCAGLTSLAVAFETSDTEDFATATTLLTTGAVPVAKLKQGYTFPMTIVPDDCLRYLRLKYVIAGTATAGKITAGVVVDRQQTRNYGW